LVIPYIWNWLQSPYVYSHINYFSILSRERCNGRFDCPNGEDEQNCPTTTAPASTTTTTTATTLRTTTQQPTTTTCTGFKCKFSEKCLSFKYVCDGTRDCPGWGEDELCCNNNTQYRCPNSPGTYLGSCIAMRNRCDGYDDCGDRSDEENCPTTTLVIQ